MIYINKIFRLTRDYQERQNLKEIDELQRRIFNYINLAGSYRNVQIQINNQQVLKTIFIKTNSENGQRTFYLGHGFGGTSLMYFPIVPLLLTKGNVVLWEIRGMGLSSKISYSNLHHSQADEFFLYGIKKVLQFYNHQKIIFISHSFGAYITIKFCIKYGQYFNIQKCLLLSPIGITPKEKDYKNKITSFNDIFHFMFSWLTWKYHLTYRSILKSIGKSIKQKLLHYNFLKYGLESNQLSIMVDLFDTLTNSQTGSQRVFYQIILPRVLPIQNQSIQQLIQRNNMQFQVKFVYGGQKDWVDKQGSFYLSGNYSNFSMKILKQCTHMLPLHVKQLKAVLQQQLSLLK